MKYLLLPIAALLLIDVGFCTAQNPVLWGLTAVGGKDSMGIIFSYDVAAGIYMDMYDFRGDSDGSGPQGTLIQANNGLLYGTTIQGGAYNAPNTSGTIFSYNITTGIESVIHSFGGPGDGNRPLGPLFQASDGLLYGTTYAGGSDDLGVFFSYNISTGIYNKILDIGSIQGGGGMSRPLIQVSDSLLYGCMGNNIFIYNILAQSYILANLDGASSGGGPLLQANNGLLYGMTNGGGTNQLEYGGAGTIFSYNISSQQYIVLHNFGGGVDGYHPFGSFVQARNGLLYGTTENGGSVNPELSEGGTIFSFDISNDSETIVHNFGNYGDGTAPRGTPIQASDGLLYGMAPEGGYTPGASIGGGMIYSFNPLTGDYANIHNFGVGNDGFAPQGNLLEADSPAIIYPPDTINNKNSNNNTQIMLYPNPARNYVILETDTGSVGGVFQITDVTGRLVFWFQTGSRKTQIPISTFGSAIYFVQLIDWAGHKWVGKLVVQ